LSLYNFDTFLKKEFPAKAKDFSSEFKTILKIYGDHIDHIIRMRHEVGAHLGQDGLDDLIHTKDLLAMPIPELLMRVERLVAEAQVTSFPVSEL